MGEKRDVRENERLERDESERLKRDESCDVSAKENKTGGGWKVLNTCKVFELPRI